MAVAGPRVGLAGLREDDVPHPRPGRCKGAVPVTRRSASSFPAAPRGVSPPSQTASSVMVFIENLPMLFTFTDCPCIRMQRRSGSARVPDNETTESLIG
ncbi:uncharacterized protein [Tursiops truncatus]|uniref:uncharacterized protein isoform X2 n=1 Tax=Tursiops truncatus TaxID=9739 RepID=UPI003CCFD72D